MPHYKKAIQVITSLEKICENEGFSDPYSPVLPALIHQNTGQWKPVFLHILCSAYLNHHTMTNKLYKITKYEKQNNFFNKIILAENYTI